MTIASSDLDKNDANKHSEKNMNSEWLVYDLDKLIEMYSSCFYDEGWKHSSKENVIVMMEDHHLPIFNYLYEKIPDAHWMLKREPIDSLEEFLHGLIVEKNSNKYLFSSLVLRKAMNNSNNRHAEKSISQEEWWLIHRIFEGVKLSSIAQRENISIKSLSSAKRIMMRKLGIKNNIELFNRFKWVSKSWL